jgi:hypothetical protein
MEAVGEYDPPSSEFASQSSTEGSREGVPAWSVSKSETPELPRRMLDPFVLVLTNAREPVAAQTAETGTVPR